MYIMYMDECFYELGSLYFNPFLKYLETWLFMNFLTVFTDYRGDF